MYTSRHALILDRVGWRKLGGVIAEKLTNWVWNPPRGRARGDGASQALTPILRRSVPNLRLTYKRHVPASYNLRFQKVPPIIRLSRAMPSRISSTASASTLSMHSSSSQSHHVPVSSSSSRPQSTSKSTKVWVDPASLPDHGDITSVSGNAPDYVKQLNYNTYFSYGVGQEDSFGHNVGKEVKFVDVSIDRKLERQGRLEATTVAEVTVTKQMLNGAGMLHGGCVAYLIDNCCSTPLVVLGLVQNVNGVGVTQAMNVLFHSPAPLGTRLSIVSTSVSLGGRVMTSRCEILDKGTGRVVASAFLNKMQPNTSKL